MSDEGTLFKNIAPFVNSGALGDFSAWRILAYPALVDKNLTAFNINQIQLARHLIATYLNSNVIANFPVTLATMKDMWEKGSLDKYCPSSSCTASQLWTAQQVVCYLRNYTMDSTVSTDPITWVCP